MIWIVLGVFAVLACSSQLWMGSQWSDWDSDIDWLDWGSDDGDCSTDD